MNATATTPPEPPPRPRPKAGFEGAILRLVQGGPERLAIEAGEIDAIVDTESGHVILLPEAQRAVLGDKAVLQSLVALCSDWSWRQDEQYRFAEIRGTSTGHDASEHAHMIGKTLWELPIDNMSESDWQMHRNQLDWRATFRDLEVRHVNAAGEMRCLCLNGEPVFDELEQFKGYRGSTRDITGRKHAEALAEGSNRSARAALDALAAEVCVLDSAGTVILSNNAWRGSRAGEGIAAGVREGANYFAVCEHAAGARRADGRAIAAGSRQVMTGESSSFEHRVVGHPATGERPFTLSVTVYRGEGVGRVVVSRAEPAQERAAERTQPLADGAASHPPEAGSGAVHPTRMANLLLAALPLADYQRLLAGLVPVTLTAGDMLHSPGATVRQVYFPIDCIVSLLTAVDGVPALDVGLIGHEGMVGIEVALGVERPSATALVQNTGTAMRMEAESFRDQLSQSPALQRAMNRYAHVLMTEFAQSAACARYHTVQARLARWLLKTRDRVRSNQFNVTQEFLARMLGARRVSITLAAGVLRERELITYLRGKIRILDHKGLAAMACRCYQPIGNLRRRRS